MARTADREGIAVSGRFSGQQLVALPGDSRRSVLRQYDGNL